MYFACISGHLPIVKLIVTAIIKQRLWDKDDARKDIITAFTANHPDIVGYLIEMGNNPNFVTIGPKRQPILLSPHKTIMSS
ncbi:MAG: hypothetical protein HWD59_07690 [Coxiellaceae bacterium]|nr:MAG: hypothetical protein HWD59_07690 [Coxiellaceae bacterium]